MVPPRHAASQTPGLVSPPSLSPHRPPTAFSRSSRRRLYRPAEPLFFKARDWPAPAAALPRAYSSSGEALVPLSIIVSPEHRVDAEEDFVLDPSFRLDDSPVINWV
ncbi:hypothetical protein ZWY2020_033280 [Hordeum vulgare]|nr:hypothetical protein ZWY2020_033280 [Hordeum vulgare]